ncbi:hypothetical protein T484DRAFT_1627340, partial [Baffinella frigidus]
FRVQGSGFRVQGSGFRVQGSGFRVQGSGFRVEGLGSCLVCALGQLADLRIVELPRGHGFSETYLRKELNSFVL